MIFRAMFSAVLLCSATVAAAQPGRQFEDQGMVLGGDVDEGGTLRIRLWEPHVRYLLLPEPEGKIEELARIVGRANETSRAVTIRYDGLAGRVNAAAGTIEYPVCAVRLDDSEWVPSAPCDDASPPAPGAGAMLAHARALAATPERQKAIELLRTLSFDEPAAREVLLRVRADAHSAAAAAEPPLSQAADRALLEALADYRALALLAPDDSEVQFSIASQLDELGAYGEAKQVLDSILARWPDEEYRVFVRYGALRRTQGDYQGALDALDQLVARAGPQEGMRYHYHRGWTLSLLGRHAEAEAEYTKGFAVQADYASAFIRRGCARASLGKLDEAIADFDEGRRLLRALPDALSGFVQEDLRALAVDRALVAAAKAAGVGKVAGTCAGKGWARYEKPRPRSPLLPPL